MPDKNSLVDQSRSRGLSLRMMRQACAEEAWPFENDSKLTGNDR